jgi:hypothetical protein
MRIVKSEWHQVERRYALEVEREQLDEIFPDLDSEEQDAIWQQLLDGEYSADELIENAHSENMYSVDWDWLDEDDWWTDRNGGYEVTYEVDADYAVPKTDKDTIRELRNEVNSLRSQLGLEAEYDTRPDAVRLEALKQEFDRLISEESEECFNCGSVLIKHDLVELNGQYRCPDCGEGWVMQDQRGGQY